jgi:hypothetical protein
MFLLGKKQSGDGNSLYAVTKAHPIYGDSQEGNGIGGGVGYGYSIEHGDGKLGDGEGNGYTFPILYSASGTPKFLLTLAALQRRIEDVRV